tara:strand:- start:6083 stop:7210 length:1128 start_codon:yes stop_codon:yes gene_type:complete
MKISTKNIKLKFIILLLLIIIPICILYFDLGEEIFFYLKNSNSNIDNFTNNNYINLCKNKNTYFYDFPTGTANYLKTPQIQSISECERQCNDNKCQIYIHNSYNNTCYLYDFSNSTTDASYIIPYNIDFSINCNDKYLPTNYYQSEYAGEGKINRYLYDNSNNRDRFNHIDYSLIESNKMINDFNYIKKLRKHYKQNFDDNNHMESTVDAIFYHYDKIHRDLNNFNLDLSKNMIFGDNIKDYYKSYPYIENLHTQQYNTDDESKKSTGYTLFLDKFNDLKNLIYSPSNKILDDKLLSYNIHKNNTNSEELESRLKDNRIETKRNIMLYSILAIIMIISVIIFLLYQFIPNIIPDYVIISYFIGILLLLYFINKLY